MNKVVLVGRLASDSKVLTTNSGVKYTRNAIAVKRDFKGKDGGYDTDFLDFVAFDLEAEFLEKYCHKGDIVSLVARLQNNTYKDTKKLEIMGEKINLVSVAQPKEETPKVEEIEPELPF